MSAAKEFPMMLYRPKEGGGIEHRSIASEAEMPAAKEGWTSYKEAKASALPEPKAPGKTQIVTTELGKQVQEWRAKAEKLQTTLAASQTEAVTANASVVSLSQRLGAMSALLERFALSDGAPADLKAEAEAMLKPPARPTPAEVKAERHARIEAKGQNRVTQTAGA